MMRMMDKQIINRKKKGLTAAQVTAVFLATLAAVLLWSVFAAAAITGDKPGEVIRACLIEEELT